MAVSTRKQRCQLILLERISPRADRVNVFRHVRLPAVHDGAAAWTWVRGAPSDATSRAVRSARSTDNIDKAVSRSRLMERRVDPNVERSASHRHSRAQSNSIKKRPRAEH